MSTLAEMFDFSTVDELLENYGEQDVRNYAVEMGVASR